MPSNLINFKTVTIALLILLSIALAGVTKLAYGFKQDYDRSYTNEIQLSKDDSISTSILLAKGELINILSERQKRLLDSLNIKPKLVKEIQIVKVFIHDTTVVTLPFVTQGKYKLFSDTSNKCFTIKGRVLADSITSIEITEKSFIGEYDAIYHKGKRRPVKILFFYLNLGPREPTITTEGPCGKLLIKDIKVED